MDTFAEPLPPEAGAWIENVAQIAATQGMDAVVELMRPFLGDVKPDIADRVEYKMTHMDPRAFVSLGRSLGDFPSMVGELGALAPLPVTVIVGANDTGLVPAADVMHDAITGSRLEVIAGAGHSPQEERPDEWLRAVEGHVTRADAS
jgi:pimeloyl-ACP methyl ester carboxylesterase